MATKVQPETLIRRSITELLRWDGWMVNYIAQNVMSVKGMADLYALKNGRSIWLEIKTATGRQSDKQKEWEQAVKAHGGEYRVVKDATEIMDLMERVTLA